MHIEKFLSRIQVLNKFRCQGTIDMSQVIAMSKHVADSATERNVQPKLQCLSDRDVT